MRTVIDYIDQKRKAAGIKSHAALARLAWPDLDPQKAGAYWKQIGRAHV
jgi:hypothetical protein